MSIYHLEKQHRLLHCSSIKESKNAISMTRLVPQAGYTRYRRYTFKTLKSTFVTFLYTVYSTWWNMWCWKSTRVPLQFSSSFPSSRSISDCFSYISLAPWKDSCSVRFTVSDACFAPTRTCLTSDSGSTKTPSLPQSSFRVLDKCGMLYAS